MPLYRFGRAAIRLARVLSAREISSQDGPAVRVTFEGKRTEIFEGDDARAILAYTASLDSPPQSFPDAAPPRPGAALLPLDPKTGRPFDR